MAAQIINATKVVVTKDAQGNEISKEERKATFQYDFGDTLQDAIAKFGEAVVFSNFKSSCTITAQSAMRRIIEKASSQEAAQKEIDDRMKDWKPGVALDKSINVQDAFMKQFATMDPEARKAILQQLKAQQ